MKGRTLVVAALVGCLLVVGTGSARAGCRSHTEDELELAKLTNATRAANGKKHLRLDPQLSLVARDHTHDMIQADRLYHSTYETLAPVLTGRWLAVGENVGSGGRPVSLHEEFMGSKTHRTTLLRKRWDRIGVGMITVGPRNWVTVLFSDGGDVGTTLKAPAC
jgi:uncharacterized protein YkwD